MADTNGAEAPTPVGQETILVVEDNEGLRRVVVRQLNELGYRVIEAQDGASALRTLESDQVDLLFTDIAMTGGWNGYAHAKHALLRWPALKTLLTSGSPETKFTGEDASKKMRLLIKPYRKDDLARTVREVLDASL